MTLPIRGSSGKSKREASQIYDASRMSPLSTRLLQAVPRLSRNSLPATGQAPVHLRALCTSSLCSTRPPTPDLCSGRVADLPQLGPCLGHVPVHSARFGQPPFLILAGSTQRG